MTLRRRPQLLRFIAVIALLLALAGAVYMTARRAGLAGLDAELHNRLTLTQHAVVTQVERYRYLPGVVAQDARVRAVLAGPAGATGAANSYLTTVRDLSGVDEIYVLDVTGRTIAASNHAERGSFVGQNYAFRPYFRQALETGQGRYYAVGVTTGIPGYFLASRIGSQDAPLGVAVAKVDMSDLPQAWAGAAQAVALADDAGVVFLSAEPEWLFRPLDALRPDTLAQLTIERRYDGHDLAAADPLRTALGGLRLAEAALRADGWRVIAALPLAAVEQQARLLAALAAMSGLLLSALALSLAQRRQLMRVRLNQNAELERRVTERTEALAHEIFERRRAQAELREAHESLIHAAKLAVLGRMSSTIVHEVSQPLSALDSTLAAAELHLRADRTARAEASLGAARALLMRMQKMVRNLKSFGSRQRLDPPEPVDMAQVLCAAAEVLAPRLAELEQSLQLGAPTDLPAAQGHPIRLEQVATNLILNAAEAAAAATSSEPIAVALTVRGAMLRLTIADRGPGIDPGLRPRIEEPFFTTRITGEGLGLGLAITRGILDQMGGQMDFAPRPGGGTLTIVDLPLWQDRAVLSRKAG